MPSAIGMVAPTVKSPHGFRRRLDDHQGQHGDQNDENAEDAHERDCACGRAHLLLHDLPERLAAAADGAEEGDGIVHGPPSVPPIRIQSVPGR